jgi:hypothetical protein
MQVRGNRSESPSPAEAVSRLQRAPGSLERAHIELSEIETRAVAAEDAAARRWIAPAIQLLLWYDSSCDALRG